MVILRHRAQAKGTDKSFAEGCRKQDAVDFTFLNMEKDEREMAEAGGTGGGRAMSVSRWGREQSGGPL